MNTQAGITAIGANIKMPRNSVSCRYQKTHLASKTIAQIRNANGMNSKIATNNETVFVDGLPNNNASTKT